MAKRKDTSTQYQNQADHARHCPIISTFNLLGGRWKLGILYRLRAEPVRYSTLRESLRGISDKMLSQQLRELEQTGFIVRESLPGVPPGSAYALTDLGKSLLPVLENIAAWGVENDAAGRYARVLTQAE